MDEHSRVVAFDDFAERECPWFRSGYSTNNGYGCAHPAQEEIEIVALLANGGNYYGDGADETGPKCLVPEGRCFSFSCPIGYSLYPSQSAEDRDLLRAAGLDPDGCSDDTWMELRTDLLPPAGHSAGA